MNINGSDKRYEFWKRVPDSIHDNNHSSQHEICCDISLPGLLIADHVEFQFHEMPEWVASGFSWQLNLLLARCFCFYVPNIQATCPSVSVKRRIPIYQLMKSSNKNEILQQNLVRSPFDAFLIARRVLSRLLQQEVRAPPRSCSETSRRDCCRREADCYYILPRNARVTYANGAISHCSELCAGSRAQLR